MVIVNLYGAARAGNPMVVNLSPPALTGSPWHHVPSGRTLLHMVQVRSANPLLMLIWEEAVPVWVFTNGVTDDPVSKRVGLTYGPIPGQAPPIVGVTQIVAATS